MNKEEKQRNKRGQFFLIAAVVIVFVLAGLTATYIATRYQKVDSSTKDLSEEIQFESGRVIDNGVFNSNSQLNISNKIESLISNYSAIYPDTDFAVIYGNKTNLNILVYNSTDIGSIGIGTITGIQNIQRRTISKYDYTPSLNSVRLQFNQANYTFQLTEGQNFFILVKRTKGGDEVVTS